MATGKEIETRGHITGFREEIEKSLTTSDDEFFTWFNNAKDKNAAFIRGAWDFMVHIGTPLTPFLADPEELSVLEIGHGGGRILAAASRAFKDAVGVDIHNNNEKVLQELASRGIENVRLIQTDGQTIPLDQESVDVVYSFIVLQHVEKMSILEKYVSEAHRVLKPGGLAVLYFGRQATFSSNRSSKLRYLIDRVAELVRLPSGFKEFPAKVNATNLVLTMPHTKKVSRRAGFNVLGELVSRKGVPNGISRYGGQHGLILKK